MNRWAYYNEIDPFAVLWIKEMIKFGLIADGEVDQRSIEDVRADDVAGFRECHFFAGIGIWALVLRQAGWPDGRPVWTGSCPCQPFSVAGKRTGFADKRHLWPCWYRLISECRPGTIIGEQVAGKAGMQWWDVVADDLENAGYAVAAANLCACSVGAPHIRQRLYWLADSREYRLQRGVSRRQDAQRAVVNRQVRCSSADCGLSNPYSEQRQWSEAEFAGYRVQKSANHSQTHWSRAAYVQCGDGKVRPIKPGIECLVDGFAGRGALLRCLGNTIVAPLAKTFVETVMEVTEHGL